MCVGRIKDSPSACIVYVSCIFLYVCMCVCARVQYLQHDMMQRVCMSSLRMCLYFCMQDLQSAVLDELGISAFHKCLLLSHPQSLETAPTVADIISPSRGIYQTCIVAHVHVSPCIVRAMWMCTCTQIL